MYKRDEIWLCDLGEKDIKGSEQGGKKYEI